jgi:predicted RNA-binding Zn ribbon-like protein
MFDWNEHRFSGGLLALDLANTVVWRDREDKRTDRFASREDVAPFAAAASRFRSDETGGATLTGPATLREFYALMGLRDAIDDWLRPAVVQATEPGLGPLFAACADATHHDVAHSLATACVRSAMRLLDPGFRVRVKMCPSCRWLFLDRSKNQSRTWCDMKVCGNRAKAHKHYQRVKQAAAS